MTFTRKEPAAPLQDRDAVAGEGGTVTLAGLIALQVRPAGSGVSERDTVPAKLFTAVTVIVEIEDVPAATGAGEEAVTVKSLNVNDGLRRLLATAGVTVELTVTLLAALATLPRVMVEVANDVAVLFVRVIDDGLAKIVKGSAFAPTSVVWASVNLVARTVT